MKKRLGRYKNSISGRINISFLLIVAIAVVSFMIISINRSSRVVKDTSIDRTLQLVNLMNQNIEFYIESMDNIAQIVTNHSDVRNYLQTAEGNKEYQARVIEQFKTLKETRNDIYNIGIIGLDGTYLINNDSIRMNPNNRPAEQEWYQRALKEGQAVSSSHVQNIVYKEYPWVVTMSKLIKDSTNQHNLGVFFADMNYRSISNLAEEVNLGQKGYVFIVDAEGNIVYHPKQQLIYSGLFQEETEQVIHQSRDVTSWETGHKLYTIARSELTGWTVVGVNDLEEMLSSTHDIISMYYLIAVMLIGFASLLAVLLTDKITLPLRRLQKSMKEVQSGNFEVNIAAAGSEDEIGDLIKTFRIMIREIENLIERNQEEQEEKRKSELNALQAQINPHFLYNTLDSIIWMAEDGNTGDVVLMTSSLAKLLRKSISNREKLVRVTEELAYTESYLTIQQMRYKDKLRYSMDVDPAIADEEIIKLVVQPLVENAIYHGIKYKEGIGTIRIVARYQEKGILIQVIDDGCGMTEEKLKHIFDERRTDERRNSVGVLNVHQRIQLYYGPEYGLSFESKTGCGTIASISLPGRAGGRDEG